MEEMQMQENSAIVRPPAKVLASAADGVVELITKNHGDVDTIFGRAAIRTNDLDSPYNELNLSQFCQLFHEAAEQTGNSNFGLQFGADFEPRRLGAIGYAAISSPTLACALRNMEAYFPAHQGQTSFGLIEDSGILWLSYRIFDQRIKDRRQDAELSLGMFVNVFKDALGEDWAPLEVRFEHARPDGAGEHERRFGAPVRFNRRTNAIAFRREDLEAVMPGHDPYLFSVIEPFLKSRCEMSGNPVDFATIVRNQIKLNLGDKTPGLRDISKMLGLSEHLFQKQLKEHNLTYNDLLRAARKELAIHYMQNPDIPLTEVALSLGYSELSAFSRAFRAWTGLSPQRYRRIN